MMLLNLMDSCVGNSMMGFSVMMLHVVCFYMVMHCMMMGFYDLLDFDYLLVNALDFLSHYLHSVFHFFQLLDKDSLVFHIGGLRNLMFQFLNLRMEMFDDQLMFVEFVNRTNVNCFLL